MSRPLEGKTLDELGHDLALCEAAQKQIRAEMLKRWDGLGTFETRGYYVAKLQSIHTEIPNIYHCARLLPSLVNDDQHHEYYLHFMRRISIVGITSAIKSLPVWPELDAMLSEADEDGGRLEVVGKARKVIAKYEPNTGKREGLQIVLEPGDVPREATQFAAPSEDEELAEMESLSPGD